MDQAEEVKSKVDIVEVISSYIPLKKAGRNFSGLCPYHSEKTPSFMVSPERQAFKCFGCGESGDVFTFLEKMEGWDFREALEELAGRVGVKLKAFSKSDTSKIKEKLLAVNNLASKFYSHLLVTHPVGEKARKYLLARGIKKTTWEKFGIGYAPEGWENTFNFLKKRNFDLSDIAGSGLVVAREDRSRSYYDRFRDRIIFPIRDSRGAIMGFSGRVLDPNAKEAKYINTPETAIFKKGFLLFGLDLAKEAIRLKNEAILVEGEFDVLSTHQNGILNVVASKGTALSDKQVAMLSRSSENVVLCFDMDLAGDAASRRGIELLDIAGVNVKVVNLGKYKDPDEFCRSDVSGFKKAIEESANIYDYFLKSADKRFDGKTPEGKKKIGAELIPILSKISDDLVRAHYIEKLSKILDLDIALVADAVNKKVSLGDVSFNAAPATEKGKSWQEEYFLTLFLTRDELEESFLSLLAPRDFENPDAREFWKWIHDIIGSSKAKSLKKILLALPKSLIGFVDDLYLRNVGVAFDDKEAWAGEMVKIAQRIKQASLKRQLLTISKDLKIAQDKGESKVIEKLNERFEKIAQDLKGVSTQ